MYSKQQDQYLWRPVVGVHWQRAEVGDEAVRRHQMVTTPMCLAKEKLCGNH